MVKVNMVEPVPPSLVALIVEENVPEVVGVPEIIPVVEPSVRPDGNVVAV